MCLCNAGDCAAVLHHILLSWRDEWCKVCDEDGVWSIPELLSRDAESGLRLREATDWEDFSVYNISSAYNAASDMYMSL